MSLHPYDDLPAYSLGALDATERETVDAHLADCAVCRAEVSALAETAYAIAQTAARDTPARLRDAIIGRAERETRPLARPRRSGDRGVLGQLGQLGQLVGALRRPIPVAVPLALALLLVVSLAGTVGARRDAEGYATALAGVAGARVVSLAGTDTALRGSVVIPASGAPAYLILDLPAPPAGKTWEAWVLNGQQPIAAGISDGRTGVTTLLLTAPLGAGDGVAVTLEPAGGSRAPTTAPVLAGRT